MTEKLLLLLFKWSVAGIFAMVGIVIAVAIPLFIYMLYHLLKPTFHTWPVWLQKLCRRIHEFLKPLVDTMRDYARGLQLTKMLNTLADIFAKMAKVLFTIGFFLVMVLFFGLMLGFLGYNIFN